MKRNGILPRFFACAGIVASSVASAASASTTTDGSDFNHMSSEAVTNKGGSYDYPNEAMLEFFSAPPPVVSASVSAIENANVETTGKSEEPSFVDKSIEAVSDGVGAFAKYTAKAGLCTVALLFKAFLSPFSN